MKQASEKESRSTLDLRDCTKPAYQGSESTCLSIYGTSPENRSGTKLCFMRYSQIAQGGHSGPVVWATVCLKDLDSGDVTELSEAEVTNHNGATAIWGDDHLLAFQKRYLNEFEVCDTQSGKLVHQGRGELGHRCTTGMIPYAVCNHRLRWYDPDAEAVPRDDEGIYTLNPYTGERTQIISLPGILEAIRDRYPTVSTSAVNVLHVDPSRCGDKFLFDYRSESVDGKKGGSYQGYVKADGTDCRILPVRCIHTLWFDNDSYYGPKGGDTARYDLQGNKIQVLGGTSLHTGKTPDGAWYGGERSGNRGVDGETSVYLFRRGKMEPVALVGKWKNWHVTWDWVAHPNPAFSYDGKRFYFTRATGGDRFEACCFDMAAMTALY